MSRKVKITTVQPPAPTQHSTPDSVQNRAMEMLEQAVSNDGSDIICLPEYMNCLACNPDQLGERAGNAANKLLGQIANLAARRKCYIIAPLLIEEEGVRRNRAHLIDRKGNVAGCFDKVHLTHIERDEWKITPGDKWPVFNCDFGRIGIMICYDGCFVEPPRIYSLKGADIVFWPSLQRSFTETELDLQTRAHAYFNYLTIVRSSYGTDPSQPWQRGAMVGLSCVAAPDGSILANTGRWAGWASTVVDLTKPQRGERSFGGDVGLLKEMRFEDRCPQSYGLFVESKHLDY